MSGRLSVLAVLTALSGTCGCDADKNAPQRLGSTATVTTSALPTTMLTPATALPYELLYTAQGDLLQPKSLRLSVDTAGRAELFINDPRALPGVERHRVGSFGAKLSAQALTPLARALRANDLLQRSGGLAKAGADERGLIRSLVLRSAKKTVTLALDDSDKALTAVEQLLLDLAPSLMKTPLAAVQASLEPSPSSPQPTMDLVLKRVGTQPVSITLCEPAKGLWAKVVLSNTETPHQVERIEIGRAHLEPLVKKGTISCGPIVLGADQAVANSAQKALRVPLGKNTLYQRGRQVEALVRFYFTPQQHVASVAAKPIPR